MPLPIVDIEVGAADQAQSSETIEAAAITRRQGFAAAVGDRKIRINPGPNGAERTMTHAELAEESRATLTPGGYGGLASAARAGDSVAGPGGVLLESRQTTAKLIGPISFDLGAGGVHTTWYNHVSLDGPLLVLAVRNDVPGMTAFVPPKRLHGDPAGPLLVTLPQADIPPVRVYQTGVVFSLFNHTVIVLVVDRTPTQTAPGGAKTGSNSW